MTNRSKGGYPEKSSVPNAPRKLVIAIREYRNRRQEINTNRKVMRSRKHPLLT